MTIFLTFYNRFMMLLHMEVHSKYILYFNLDSISISSGVQRAQRPKTGWQYKSRNCPHNFIQQETAKLVNQFTTLHNILQLVYNIYITCKYVLSFAINSYFINSSSTKNTAFFAVEKCRLISYYKLIMHYVSPLLQRGRSQTTFTAMEGGGGPRMSTSLNKHCKFY